MHEVLVNCLFKLAQEKRVVMCTDRPTMTIAVDLDVKQQNKQTNTHTDSHRERERERERGGGGSNVPTHANICAGGHVACTH